MVYVFLADGFEEMEAIAPIDLLRRGGVQVKTVGVGTKIVCGAHGIPFICDIEEGEIVTEGMEMVVLPGGMPGTANLDKSEAVERCLASVLGHKGLLQGKRATCFPGFEQELTGAEFTGAAVEQDGKIITAKGAGAAVEFALKLVEALKGASQAQGLKEAIQCQE